MGETAAPGDRIGRYIIEAPLGHGGMGRVYRAYDEVLHRHVALKLLHPAPEGSAGGPDHDGGVARIVREARMAAALTHPNVVAVHDVGEHEGAAFIVMEHVAGTSLATFVARSDEVPLAQRVAWLTDVARALDAAHRVGLVHRDIKPENVMVRADGTTKVLDFGIARPPRERRSAPPSMPPASAPPSGGAFTLGSTVEDGALVGTPGYIAPEQLRHGAFDARSDQFAWGVLAYELLAGGLPWSVPETDVTALVTATLFDEPAPLGARRPELPEAVASVVHRALAKAPAARFESMEALLAAWTSACAPLGHAGAPFAAPSLAPREGASSREDAPAEIAVAPTIQAPSVEVRKPSPSRRVTRPSERTPSPATTDASALDRAPSRPDARARSRAMAVTVAAVIALGAGAGGVAAWRARRRGRGPTAAAAAATPFVFASRAPRRVTLDEGCEELPALLPDGRRVVFDAASGRDYHLFELDLTTGARRELTSGTGWDFAAAVSPDGRLLAYRHSGGEGGVFVRPYDGSAPARRIALGATRPAFSPDGRALWASDEQGTVTRIDVASGAVQRTLRAPEGASVLHVLELPDGRVAVRLSSRESNDPMGIGLFPRTGGAMRWLVNHRVGEVLALMPGGRDLITARYRAGATSEPWRIPLDGSAPSPIPGTDVLPVQGLAIARDGTRAVWSTCESRPDIAALVPDGEHPGRLRAVRLWDHRDWADALPTGVHGTDLVVLASDRSGSARAWVIDRRDREPPRMIATLPDLPPTSFAVSADRRLVAMSTARSGIYVAPFDGTGTARHVTTGNADRHPSLSPDGRRLFYEAYRDDGRSQIMSVPVEGTAAPEPVLPPGNARPSLAPDGRTLAYIQLTDHQNGVPWLYDLATHQRRLLSAALPAARYEAVQFSHDGRRAAASDSVNRVTEVDAATGAVIAQYDSGGDQAGDPAYTASGLVLGRSVWSGDLWVAEGTFR